MIIRPSFEVIENDLIGDMIVNNSYVIMKMELEYDSVVSWKKYVSYEKDGEKALKELIQKFLLSDFDDFGVDIYSEKDPERRELHIDYSLIQPELKMIFMDLFEKMKRETKFLK